MQLHESGIFENVWAAGSLGPCLIGTDMESIDGTWALLAQGSDWNSESEAVGTSLEAHANAEVHIDSDAAGTDSGAMAEA